MQTFNEYISWVKKNTLGTGEVFFQLAMPLEKTVLLLLELGWMPLEYDKSRLTLCFGAHSQTGRNQHVPYYKLKRGSSMIEVFTDQAEVVLELNSEGRYVFFQENSLWSGGLGGRKSHLHSQTTLWVKPSQPGADVELELAILSLVNALQNAKVPAIFSSKAISPFCLVSSSLKNS